jgi:hypothetical protein
MGGTAVDNMSNMPPTTNVLAEMTMQDLFRLYVESSELVAATLQQLRHTREGDANYRELMTIHQQMVNKRNNCLYSIASEARNHPESVEFLERLKGDSALQSIHESLKPISRSPSPSPALSNASTPISEEEIVANYLNPDGKQNQQKTKGIVSPAQPQPVEGRSPGLQNHPELTEVQQKYIEKIRSVRGDEAADEETRRLLNDKPKPLERVTKFTDDDIDVILRSIKDAKVKEDQAKKLIIDVFRQQQGQNPKSIASKISSFIMCITKEQYGTDFDLRYYILERTLEVFQGNEEVLKELSADANCMLRIGNWLRYDLRSKLASNVRSSLRFLSSMKMITEQLTNFKLIDVLTTMLKRSEFKESAEKVIRDAERRQKELSPETISKPSKTKKSIPPIIISPQEPKPRITSPSALAQSQASLAAPRKFSVADYIKRKPSSSEASFMPAEGAYSSTTAVVSYVNNSGVKSILRPAGQVTKKKSARVHFKNDKDLVEVKVIPLGSGNAKSIDESTKAKDMEISEGILLKNSTNRPNKYDILEEEISTEWEIPKLVNFELGDTFALDRATVVRGGSVPLELSDDTALVKRPTGYETSYSPHEPNSGLITEKKLFRYDGESAVGVLINNVLADKSISPVLPKPVLEKQPLPRPTKVSPLDHADDDLLTILADGDKLVDSYHNNENQKSDEDEEDGYDPADPDSNKRPLGENSQQFGFKRSRPNTTNGTPPDLIATLSRRSRSGELPLRSNHHNSHHNDSYMSRSSDCAEYPTHISEHGLDRISRAQYELRCCDNRPYVRLTSPFESSKYTEKCSFYRPNKETGCRWGSSCHYVHLARPRQ